MKLSYPVVIIILLLFNFLVSSAQESSPKIYGKVLDETGTNQPYLKLMLFRYSDSVLVRSVLTDSAGSYNFDGLAFQKYQLRVETMGFVKYRSNEVTLSKEMPIVEHLVKLKEVANTLNQINITGKKAYVEQKIDRTVVNVDALISNAGTSALDVIAKSPGVSVDQNGQISFKGKAGVSVFIDDKPTFLSGAELESYLRSLPSSSLAQIELMSNPPAKYDAAGNAGIINIKTKKNTITGFNGSLNLSVNQGELTRSNNSINLNYRKNKINVFGNFSYSLNQTFTDLDLRRIYKNADDSPKTYFNQHTLMNRRGDSFNAKVGIDFYHNEHTTFGAVITGASTPSSRHIKSTSNLLNPSLLPDSVIKADNLDETSFTNMAFNLNFRQKFKKDAGDIALDVDYLNYNYQSDQTYDNYSYLPDNTLKYQDFLRGDLPSDIKIYAAKADYTKALNKEWKLSAGVKASLAKTDNKADYFYTINDVTTLDYEKTNHFLYQESINSGYVNFAKEGKRLAIQAGLRFENTISDGHQLGNLVKLDSTFRRTYNNLFPTIYLSYKVDTTATHHIGLNFGRRIERPFYRQLNPFYAPLDKFTYYLGNPFLRPTFIQSIEFSHTFKGKVTTTLGYSWLKDQVNETIQILDGTYYSKPGNTGKGTVKSAAVNADFKLAKWLTTHFYARLDHIITKTDFYTGYLVTNGTYFATSPNLQFKISPTWNAEVSFSYQSKLSTAQFLIGSVHEFGAAVQKKLSEKSNLKLSASDIFKTRVYTGIINNLAATSAGWTNRSDSRSLILTYSYRFGKSFATPAKKTNTGADTEKQRVGN